MSRIAPTNYTSRDELPPIFEGLFPNRWFGDGRLNEKNPGGYISGGTFEMNGLSRDFQPPADAAVLFTGTDPSAPRGDRRDYYVVRFQGLVFLFRVCSAMAGSAYECYACGEWTFDEDDNAATFIGRVQRWTRPR